MPVNSPHEFFVQLHLTERCNLRCRHCYQNERTADEMTLKEIVAVIDETFEMLNDWKENYDMSFTSSFNITGGEPFLRRGVFSVLDELKDKGFQIYVLTNGTLISRVIAKQLSVQGVQVSIEGPEKIHDAIRGEGSFAASLKGIGHLLDAGIEVTLNTTLSAVNAAYFTDVMELATRLGVQRVGFSRLVPAGEGRKLQDALLAPDVLKELYEGIFSRNNPGLRVTTGDPVALQLRNPFGDEGADPFPAGGCAAGVSGVTILSDGTVVPCRRLPIPLGNVRKDSLRESGQHRKF